MIKEALHSVGLDLGMEHNQQNLLLSLFHQSRIGSLVVSAKSNEGCDLVEFYTVSGQSLFPLWMVVKLYMIHQVWNCATMQLTDSIAQEVHLRHGA